MVGNDHLTIKGFPDATVWREALRADRHTGKVSFAAINGLTRYAVSPLSDSRRFAGTRSRPTIDSFSFPSYITIQNGTNTSDAGKFIHDNNGYGGTAGTLPSVVKNFVDMIRSVDHRRYGSEFRVAQLMGSGTNFAQTISGVSLHVRQSGVWPTRACDDPSRRSARSMR